MTGIKRALALLLSICVAFTLCGGIALAQSESAAFAAIPAAESDFTIREGVITGYTGGGGDIAVPGTIDGQVVTGVGDYVFTDNAALTGITLPDTVTLIGDSAFGGCVNLARVELPAGLQYIQGYAFAACEALTRVELPAGTKEIGGWAFAECTALQGITLGNSLEYIGSAAFLGCTVLDGVTLPATLQEIGGEAFLDCAALTEITLPAALSTLESRPFVGCSSLLAIRVAEGNASFRSEDGMLADMSGNLIAAPGGVTGALYIPRIVTTLGAYALEECRASAVYCSFAVTTVQDNAFRNCPALTKVALLPETKAIGEQAFAGCDKAALTIAGMKGTAAQAYAEQNGIAFLPIYEVRFLDYDDSELDVQLIEEGDDATTPEEPTREGYRFAGWDKEFADVREDLTIHATYVKTYTVRFLDYDERELSAQTVDEGQSATPPEEPTREGYRFVGWDKGFTDVREDLTVHATYAKTYTVRFLDYDERELSAQTVDEGQSATPPEEPTREGYRFVGWDKEFADVREDLTIHATYEPIPVGRVATPVLSPASGNYVGGMTVGAICETEGAALYYTLDGSDPDAQSEAFPAAGLVIDKQKYTNTVNLRVIALREGMQDSDVAVATYVIYQRGDANMDGAVNASDALRALQIALGIYAPTPLELAIVDLDGTGTVNASVALRILQYALGIIPDL